MSKKTNRLKRRVVMESQKAKKHERMLMDMLNGRRSIKVSIAIDRSFIKCLAYMQSMDVGLPEMNFVAIPDAHTSMSCLHYP